MRVAVVYCHPCVNGPIYQPAARRFTGSYVQNPTGASNHELYVVLNGATDKQPIHDQLFAPLAPNYIVHNNWGKDIGAFQVAAQTIDCDLLVCFGAHIYFHRAGWLDRMVQVCEENGPAMYGAWGVHHPLPHLRTTGFWLPPQLLRCYPHMIGDAQRYSFEHGNESITLWSQRVGFEPLQVTWSGTYAMKDWRLTSRQDSLFWDQWFDRFGI